MASGLSRRKIAQYVAAQIAAGEKVEPLMRELAAYLVEHRRGHEYDLMVRDIESALQDHGTIIADVTTAEKTGIDYKKAIAQLKNGASHIMVREHVDPDVVGGVKIDLPDETYDATIRKKLDRLEQLTA